MISFPNAKVNLGLHVMAKRNDGFHELETVLFPVKWADALEIVPGNESDFNLTIKGADLGDPKQNLCYKAYSLLKNDHHLPNINCYLHKVIPHGAGMGGGSSDAAAMLLMLNDIFKLRLSKEDLAVYALKLGSDCPFFIYNRPFLATGRGEVFAEVNVKLDKYFIAIVKPPVSISTKEAYSFVKPKQPDIPLDAVIKLPVDQWKYALVNDFEKNIFEKYPAVASVKTQLYENGAVYASMSGSGSSVFGIFRKATDLASLFPDCIVWQGAI